MGFKILQLFLGQAKSAPGLRAYLMSSRYPSPLTDSDQRTNEARQVQINAVIPAEDYHTGTVIFLHGLGYNGGRWISKFQPYRIPYIKYLFPTALGIETHVQALRPTRPVTWRNQMEMPAWFDVKGLEYDQYDKDEDGIRNAVKSVHQLILEEIEAGTPSTRIILGGFSQGGGIALLSGLTFGQPLAALIGLSCRIPLHGMLTAQSTPLTSSVPLLHCHGDADQITPISMAQQVHDVIRKVTQNHTFKIYNGLVHTTCDQEMNHVKDFITTYLPALQ